MEQITDGHHPGHSGADHVSEPSAAFLQQLKKTQRPVVLTVNDKAAAVVQDAEAYQRLLDLAAQADAKEGIRQGREDVAKGRVMHAREALKSFRREHGLSR
ncbi:MAG TPA: hypothetical protein VKS22_11590 [Candidatus Binataceae bacterium]|nr:hypothetical protein [Candidatus Binataceae bacterium]